MQWWHDMSLLQQIFFCIALPATVVMIVQSVLIAIGFGGDSDFDGGDVPDGDPGDGDAGIGAFILRGLMAFFTMGGWMGVGLGATSLADGWVIAISVATGIAGFVGIAFLIKSILKLQAQGNIDYRVGIGKTAKVYIPVPAKRQGVGKITMTLQEQFLEIDAMSDENEKIATDELVRIADMIDEHTALVARISDAKSERDDPASA